VTGGAARRDDEEAKAEYMPRLVAGELDATFAGVDPGAAGGGGDPCERAGTETDGCSTASSPM